MKRSREEFQIRPIQTTDREVWEPLWRGYLNFYDRSQTDQLIGRTWQRLTESGEIHGLLAFEPSGKALGLAHYFFHPSTLTEDGSCYMQDLFVCTSARKRGVGRRLIAAIVDRAKRRRVAVVYWQTEEFNGTARRLYERIAKRSPFIRYQIDLLREDHPSEN
jgi:GNAT superfamily N-acetyltransferase